MKPAHRDVLRLRHAVLTAAADAAGGRGQGPMGRQLRSELKMLAALPVAQLRAQADEVARELRELDVRIQRSNWEVDLLDCPRAEVKQVVATEACATRWIDG